jgi:hypothetical protein
VPTASARQPPTLKDITRRKSTHNVSHTVLIAAVLAAAERTLGWLLAGRDGRLLLVTMGGLLGAPMAALALVTATSVLSLGLRVAFLRRRRVARTPGSATEANL